jgi:DNA-binding response OmpR family regulator
MEGSATLAKKQVFKSNDLYIDPIGYQVKVGQKEIELTLNEFNLLYLFANNRGKVVKRSELLHAISTPGIVNEDRAINVMICRLRRKIEIDPHRPRRIVSVRGLGYRLKE